MAELLAELLSGVWRFLVHLFVELMLEMAIKGLGFILVKPFSQKNDMDSGLSAVVGILAWVGIFVIAYALFSS